jgi:hypothetical protein
MRRCDLVEVDHLRLQWLSYFRSDYLWIAGALAVTAHSISDAGANLDK